MVSLTNISAYIIKDKKLFKHSDSWHNTQLVPYIIIEEKKASSTILNQYYSLLAVYNFSSQHYVYISTRNNAFQIKNQV
jgi:hypothetical protein